MPHAAGQPTNAVVFLHGEGLGPWIWDDVRPLMRIPTLAIQRDPDTLHKARPSNLVEQAAQMAAAQIEADVDADSGIVIVAHGLAGLIAQELIPIAPREVVGLVAVSAAFTEPGQSFLSTLPVPQRHILRTLNLVVGTRPPNTSLREDLCSELPSWHQELVVDRYRSEPRELYTDTVTAPLPRLRSLYISALEDREYLPSLQVAYAAHLHEAEVATLRAGHLPMMSQPRRLATLVRDFVASLTEATDAPNRGDSPAIDVSRYERARALAHEGDSAL